MRWGGHGRVSVGDVWEEPFGPVLHLVPGQGPQVLPEDYMEELGQQPAQRAGHRPIMLSNRQCSWL